MCLWDPNSVVQVLSKVTCFFFHLSLAPIDRSRLFTTNGSSNRTTCHRQRSPSCCRCPSIPRFDATTVGIASRPLQRDRSRVCKADPHCSPSCRSTTRSRIWKTQQCWKEGMKRNKREDDAWLLNGYISSNVPMQSLWRNIKNLKWHNKKQWSDYPRQTTWALTRLLKVLICLERPSMIWSLAVSCMAVYAAQRLKRTRKPWVQLQAPTLMVQKVFWNSHSARDPLWLLYKSDLSMCKRISSLVAKTWRRERIARRSHSRGIKRLPIWVTL